MNNTASNQLLYRIALTLLPNVGSVLAKNLLAYCGSPEEVFKTSKARLEKIPLIGKDRAETILHPDSMHAALKDAEQELKFIDDYKIQTLFFIEENYPKRLKNCDDSPVMLYYKGNADLNVARTVAIVGTRKATAYGKELTRKLIQDLTGQNILIISGLAYGIDIAAHQSALENGLNTVGVLGHGLNIIYPEQHKPTAKKMVEQGGLLTEYISSEKMSPHNFPNRNRIIAGLSDAVVVIESGIKGGSVITAEIANTYSRDVFAYPGRTTDKLSTGCNFLIKTNKAAMIESGEDLLKAMMWNEDKNSQPNKAPRQLSLNLSAEEQKIFELLQSKGEAEIDFLFSSCGMSSGQLAGLLLEMELNGWIVALPGKRYRVNA